MAKKSAKPKPNKSLDHIAESLRPLAVPISDLVLDPANARTHNDANLAGITGSLHVYGQRKPIVVNSRTNVIEAGNGTVLAARKLGWDFIAAVFVDDDPSTAAGFSISDNRTAELAEWNPEALDALLRDVNTGNEALQEMLADLAEAAGIIPPNFEPGNEDDQGKLDEKAKVTCPECGHEFTP